MSEQLVMTEEEYLASKGCSLCALGDPGLYTECYMWGPVAVPGSYTETVRLTIARQERENAEVWRRRELFRRDYYDKIESGEIRIPTREEQLRKAATGHPDNASTQAAIRLLAKMDRYNCRNAT
jgi:hypothetical protein